MKKIFIISLCAAVTLLTGCAPIDPPIQSRAYVSNLTSAKQINSKMLPFAVEVDDLRGGDSNLLGVVRQVVGSQFGDFVTFHNLKLDEPVADFVNQALTTGLQKQGFKITDKSSYKLKVEILTTSMAIDQGITKNKYIFTIAINLIFLDSKNNSILWKSRFNSTGSYIQSTFTWKNMNDYATNETLDNAMDNLLTQIIKNSSFIEKIPCGLPQTS